MQRLPSKVAESASRSLPGSATSLLLAVAILLIGGSAGHAGLPTLGPTATLLPDISTWATLTVGLGSFFVFKRRR